MMNPQELDFYFETFMSNLVQFIPDGITEVDLSILHDLGLLNCEDEEDHNDLSQSFYVIESQEKLTLFNQMYIVWIVPKMVDQIPTTYTLVALNEPNHPHLEMVFSTTGVYNHSNLVLRILERFLKQIEENEQEICKIKGL